VSTGGSAVAPVQHRRGNIPRGASTAQVVGRIATRHEYVNLVSHQIKLSAPTSNKIVSIKKTVFTIPVQMCTIDVVQEFLKIVKRPTARHMGFKLK